MLSRVRNVVQKSAAPYARVSAAYFARAPKAGPGPSHGRKDPYPSEGRPEPSARQPDVHRPPTDNNAIQENQPDEWQPVQDPAGSGGIYWHNPRTGQTTPVGYPKPEKASTTLGMNVLWGAGMAVLFGLLGRLLGGF